MQKNNFQNSLGVLNKNVIDVDIKSINYLRHIPAFTTPSTISIPLLVKSNDQFFCLSGDELIHNTIIDQNEKNIACLVEDHDNDSMLELNFRKVSFHMVPEGGRCSYGEKVRAIRCLEMMIRDSVENIIVNDAGDDLIDMIFAHEKEGYELLSRLFLKNQEQNIKHINFNLFSCNQKPLLSGFFWFGRREI